MDKQSVNPEGSQSNTQMRKPPNIRSIVFIAGLNHGAL